MASIIRAQRMGFLFSGSMGLVQSSTPSVSRVAASHSVWVSGAANASGYLALVSS